MPENKKIFNILFLTKDKYPPYRVDVDVLFGKELASRGHVIDLIIQSDFDCNRSYQTNWIGGRAWVGRTENRANLLGRVLKHLFGFIHNCIHVKHIFIENYHFVQAKDRYISSLVFLIASKIKGLPFIYWLSYPFAEASLQNYWNKTARYPIIYFLRGNFYKFILYKIIMRYAVHVFVQSEQMKRDICREGININKLTPIPMGYEEDSLVSEVDNNLRQGFVDSLNVVYLGTMSKLRRVDFVIKMFAFVVARKPNAKLIMIGGSDDNNDIILLKKLANKLGIGKNIVFTGFIQRSKALESVLMANVCLSPFFPTPVLNSTSPTKLIEYMALGKSVVANDHPEQKIVIADSQAGICVPYNERKFAEAVIYLLENPRIAEEMGRRGQKWVQVNRRYDVIADLVESQYLNIISK